MTKTFYREKLINGADISFVYRKQYIWEAMQCQSFEVGGLGKLAGSPFDYMKFIIHMSCLLVYADGSWGPNSLM